MKRLFTLLLVCCSTALIAQPCLPEGIHFQTQEDIDNFQANYPGCTEIEGDVIIGNQEETWIFDLDGLNSLTSIGGSLLIQSLIVLPDLEGLSNLSSIGGFLEIVDCDGLTSLEGLGSLETIGEDLIIQYNSNVGSLETLGNLSSPINGLLRIKYNGDLVDLYGLHNIPAITGNLEIKGNFSLQSLEGLSNLTTIGENLIIVGNDSLTSLAGLESISSLGQGISIVSNDNLVDISSLNNFISIDGILSVISNSMLSNLEGLNNLSYINGSLTISDNNSLNSISALENITTINGDLVIDNNTILTNLAGLDNIDPSSIENLTIFNNSLLTNCNIGAICNYLNNINGTVRIYNNASGCNNPSEIANNCGTSISCLPYGNYYFMKQSDIDNFLIDFANCNDLNGSVAVKSDEISELDNLISITSVEGDFYIHFNSQLEDLTGLNNLTSIGGKLEIKYNSDLTNLTGLNNLTSIGDNLQILFNNNLSECDVEGICNYITGPNAQITIYNNAPGCNYPEEVEEACLTGIDDIYNLDEEFEVFPNPVNELINFKIQSPNSYNQFEIEIRNLYGKLVKEEKNIQSSHYTMDISDLKAGVYFYVIKEKEEVVQQGKLIKK